jgi:hypothetical protein
LNRLQLFGLVRKLEKEIETQRVRAEEYRSKWFATHEDLDGARVSATSNRLINNDGDYIELVGGEFMFNGTHKLKS